MLSTGNLSLQGSTEMFEAKYFEDYQIGAVRETLGRTITDGYRAARGADW